jgi:hypothetical protein
LTDRGVQTGHHVEQRDAGAVRLAVGLAGQAHEPGDGLHDQVVAGQLLAARAAAEAADRGVDDPGVVRRHGGVVQAEAAQAAGLEVLDEHVGAAGQLLRQHQVVGVLQVEGDRPLVAVDAEVVRGDPVADRRLPGAGVVAGGALDLHDLGAEVGEQHRGIGPGEDPREVGHEQSGERA